MQVQTAGSGADGGRIGAIDALRGFALAGIFLINILAMGGPIETSTPAAPASPWHPDWQVWLAAHVFVDGAMRGLFSMLFGASTLLFLREGNRSGAFLRRCLWLLVFGIANATLLLWPGDILIIYALAGPVVLMLSGAGPRRLMLVAALIIAVVSAWSYAREAYRVPEPAQAPGVAAQVAATAAAEERLARLGSYGDTLAFMSSTTLSWNLSPATLWWVLDAIAFMLLGMALFRMGLLDGRAPRSTYLMLAVAGLTAGTALRTWEALAGMAAGGVFPAAAQATFQVGRLAMTLGWLGAFMLAWQRFGGDRGAFVPLSALGRMALTFYLAQSAVGAWLFSGFGLGLWNQLSMPALWALVPFIMGVFALVGMAWLSVMRMGPAEWLWRALIFGTLPRLLVRGRDAR